MILDMIMEKKDFFLIWSQGIWKCQSQKNEVKINKEKKGILFVWYIQVTF